MLANLSWILLCLSGFQFTKQSTKPNAWLTNTQLVFEDVFLGNEPNCHIGAALAEPFSALLAAKCGAWLWLIHFQVFPPSLSKTKNGKANYFRGGGQAMGAFLMSLLEVSPGNAAGFWG